MELQSFARDTIELITKPTGKDGIKHTRIIPEEVIEWMGRGSRLRTANRLAPPSPRQESAWCLTLGGARRLAVQVKFKKIWCVGEVVGRKEKGILVKLVG